MTYAAPMTKEPALGVRLESHEKAALERAAKADQRPLSAMIRKITTEWLRANGWLEPERLAVEREMSRREGEGGDGE
jgi:hypothetical protein